MKARIKSGMKWGAAAMLLLLAAGIAAPYLNADRYGEGLRHSLERALGGRRRVEIGRVHFNLFKGPGLSVDSVTIHEDPAIGAEPIVYVQEDSGSLEVVPSLWSLLGGKFVISSIRLSGARINLAKSGPASEWGRWNFAALVDPSALSAAPAIHVRNSRVNLKFGDEKSVVYLTESDLDITPPSTPGGGWGISCDAKPARTDRTAQGLVSFKLRGKWRLKPEHMDLDLTMEQAGLGQIEALLSGQSGGVHGSLSAKLHLAGPLERVGVSGRISVEDVHRWDMLPGQSQGWTLNVGGSVNLLSQSLQLESASAKGSPLPLALRFHAESYLTQPRWSAGIVCNELPLEPILELARHLGVKISPDLKLRGFVNGELAYGGNAAFEGKLGIRDAAFTIPGSAPVEFEQAELVFGEGHARLAPSKVKTASGEEARVEAQYDIGLSRLDLSISAEAMNVASLRAQASLAAVPFLEQLTSGFWKGTLRYRSGPEPGGWTGRLDLTDGEILIPGLADPLRVAKARVRIDGARVAISRAEARAGKTSFGAEYSYEPRSARPHKVQIVAPEADAAMLEEELAPTLRRAGLIGQALGRAPAPEWLKERKLEGTVQIGDLTLAGSHWKDFHVRAVWDGARVDLTGIQAKLDRAEFSGSGSVNLRGTRPAYKLDLRAKGLAWQGGRIDAEGSLDTSGTGPQVLSNMTVTGIFSATALDLGLPVAVRSLAGDYAADWLRGPVRLRFNNLTLRAGDEIYTGRGGTQDDGHIAVTLASGAKTIRLTGTPDRLRVEEAAH